MSTGDPEVDAEIAALADRAPTPEPGRYALVARILRQYPPRLPAPERATCEQESDPGRAA